nr:MAG TPA_asm: hypothetical protein [Caudoviricetes sp.]
MFIFPDKNIFLVLSLFWVKQKLHFSTHADN